VAVPCPSRDILAGSMTLKQWFGARSETKCGVCGLRCWWTGSLPMSLGGQVKHFERAAMGRAQKLDDPKRRA